MEFHKPPFRLREIKIEVTHNCRLRCIHCSSNGVVDSARNLSFDKVIDILEQAAGLGVAEVSFTGGEPLLWLGLRDAISKASASGMRVLVYTSGNVDAPGKAMATLAHCGTQRVVLSVFAADAETHDAITGVGGSLHRTLEALDEAAKIGLYVELHFVPTSINYMKLPHVVSLAREKGIRRVSVLRFVPHGRGESRMDLVLTQKQNLELKRLIEAARTKLDVRTGSPYNFLLVNEKPRCFAAIDRLSISPDLRIYPCDGFKQIDPQQIAGTDRFSSLDRWTLAECWGKSPYLNRVREYLTTPFAEPCASCRRLEDCVSGCLAQKVIAQGNLAKSPDPMCLLQKVQKA